MTNRFRSDYGTAVFNDSRMADLPLDENHGVAWQSTTCVSMRRGWLLIPIILTAVTSILAIWTMTTDWRQRHSRPVWKDNILPLLFYGRDMVDDKLDAHSHRKKELAAQDDVDATTSNAPLLETREMEKISAGTAINIRWLFGAKRTVAEDGGKAPRSTSLTRRIWRPRKREEHSSNSLLLEPYGGGRTQRGGSEGEISLEAAEPYEGSQGNIDNAVRSNRQMRWYCKHIIPVVYRSLRIRSASHTMVSMPQTALPTPCTPAMLLYPLCLGLLARYRRSVYIFPVIILIFYDDPFALAVRPLRSCLTPFPPIPLLDSL